MINSNQRYLPAMIADAQSLKKTEVATYRRIGHVSLHGAIFAVLEARSVNEGPSVPFALRVANWDTRGSWCGRSDLLAVQGHLQDPKPLLDGRHRYWPLTFHQKAIMFSQCQQFWYLLQADCSFPSTTRHFAVPRIWRIQFSFFKLSNDSLIFVASVRLGGLLYILSALA